MRSRVARFRVRDRVSKTAGPPHAARFRTLSSQGGFMSLSNRRRLPIAFALLLALAAPLAALAALSVGPDDGGVAPAVRVIFLDKLGPRAAQKLLMAEGVRRV